jgi:hypothetical protein
MFGIPRRYSHFIFAVIQAGLTCLIAAGIASLPLVSIRQFMIHWLLSWLLDNDAARCHPGCPHDSLCFTASHERRVMSGYCKLVRLRVSRLRRKSPDADERTSSGFLLLWQQ